jgi:hypothetical protein
MSNISKSVQFYATDKQGNYGVHSFKVNNENDARKALTRFKQRGGYYVERHKLSGKVITNKFIRPIP